METGPRRSCWLEGKGTLEALGSGPLLKAQAVDKEKLGIIIKKFKKKKTSKTQQNQMLLGTFLAPVSSQTQLTSSPAACLPPPQPPAPWNLQREEGALLKFNSIPHFYSPTLCSCSPFSPHSNSPCSHSISIFVAAFLPLFPLGIGAPQQRSPLCPP